MDSPAFEFGVEHHVVVTYNPEGEATRLYLNGRLVGSDTSGLKGRYSSAQPNGLGLRGDRSCGLKGRDNPVVPSFSLSSSKY